MQANLGLNCPHIDGIIPSGIILYFLRYHCISDIFSTILATYYIVVNKTTAKTKHKRCIKYVRTYPVKRERERESESERERGKYRIK